MPLITPPAPPQLEADKADLEAHYSHLTAVLEQLQTESNDLKTAQEEQRERIDSVLKSVNSAVDELQQQSERRDVDMRGFKSDVDQIRDLIPKVTKIAFLICILISRLWKGTRRTK
jgi:hypothetical protein